MQNNPPAEKVIPDDKTTNFDQDLIMDQSISTDFSCISINKINHPVDFLLLKDLVQNTKDAFGSQNPNDTRWPCSFCVHMSVTKIKCRLHIIRDHPNMDKNLNHFENLSPSTQVTITDVDDECIIDTDLSNLPPVINLQNSSADMACPRCTNSTKTFKGVRGLKAHYSHFHRDFISELTLPSQDPNDIICQRCTSKVKICKGFRGLKIHYSHAHKEFESDLSHQQFLGQCSDHLNSSCDLERFTNELILHKQTIRVLKRIPRGARKWNSWI